MKPRFISTQTHTVLVKDQPDASAQDNSTTGVTHHRGLPRHFTPHDAPPSTLAMVTRVSSVS